MDQDLMTVVNLMGMAIFLLVVAYHFVTASPKDAEA